MNWRFAKERSPMNAYYKSLIYHPNHRNVEFILKMWKDVVSIDSEILGGKPVFRETHVPIGSLFDHPEGGVSIDEFFEDFPNFKMNTVLDLGWNGFTNDELLNEMFANVFWRSAYVR